MRKVLFVGDIHAPYHSRPALALACKFAAEYKPDILVQLGDLVDGYSVSRHPKDPRMKLDFGWEIDVANDVLTQLTDAAKAKVVYWIGGNHDEYVERYVHNHAPAISSMTSIEQMLRLKQRGVKFCRWHDYLRLGKVFLTHGMTHTGAMAHVQSAKEFGASLVIGHTHRLAVSYWSDALGKHHVAAMAGCLADFKHAAYAHKAVRNSWMHGLLTGDLADDGTMHIRAHPFVNGRVVLDGKEIK